jgi:hypothetical protein
MIEGRDARVTTMISHLFYGVGSGEIWEDRTNTEAVVFEIDVLTIGSY